MAKKSKMVATGVMKNVLSDGTCSYTADIEIKGYPRMKKVWDTLDNAKLWRAKEITRLKAMAAGQYVAPEGTVGAIITRYIREFSAKNGGWSRSKQGSLDKIVEQIGHVELKDFNKRTMIEYGRKLAETRGKVGVAERLNYLSKAFKIARRSWDVPAPCEAVREGMGALRDAGLVGTTNPRNKVVEPSEIAKIKQHLGATARDIVDFLMIVPFRVSETVAIEWADVDEVNRRVRLHRKDTRPDRDTYARETWVPLPVIETIRDGKVVEVDTFDLINKRDRSQFKPFPLPCGQEMSRQFSMAHKLAGIDDIHLHDLRAEAISSLQAQGFDWITISELSGHNDINTMKKHYSRPKPRKVHEQFQRQIKINQAARRAA